MDDTNSSTSHSPPETRSRSRRATPAISPKKVTARQPLKSSSDSEYIQQLRKTQRQKSAASPERKASSILDVSTSDHDNENESSSEEGTVEITSTISQSLQSSVSSVVGSWHKDSTKQTVQAPTQPGTIIQQLDTYLKYSAEIITSWFVWVCDDVAPHLLNPGVFTPIIALLICCLIYLKPPGSDMNQAQHCVTGEMKADKFTVDMKRVKEEFTGQDKMFWKKISVAVKENLRMYPRPETPAVLLIGYQDDSEKCVRQLMRKIGQAAVTASCSNSTPVNLVDIDRFISSGRSAIDIKKELDSEIIGVLENEHSLNILGLHHIEKLPPEASFLLHNYCDDQYAPYKKALIFLTVELPSGAEIISENAERAMFDRLENAWNKPPHIGVDQIKPILSRISGYSALFKSTDINCT